MAIDSETKRRSALGMIIMALVIAPVPDGTIADIDREHIIGIYAGIAPVTPSVQTSNLHIFSTSTVEPNHVSDSGDNVLFAGDIEVQNDAFVDNDLTVTGNITVGAASGSGIPLDVDVYNDNICAKFGSSEPIYMLIGRSIGFNLYVDSAGTFKFGKGSSEDHCGLFGLGANGEWVFRTSERGNADATATLTQRMTILSSGEVRIGDDTNYTEITATGDLVFVGTAGLVFGSMYNDNTPTTVTIGTSGTFERIPSGFTVGQLNNTTFANAREITVLKAGMYKIDWSISFNSDAGSNLDMEGAIGIGGTKNIQGSAHRLIGAGNDIGNIAGTAILDLAANAVVSLMMTNNTNTVNITVDHASLTVMQVRG